MKNLSLEYQVRQPMVQSNSKPPLLLMLHGYGSNEQDLYSFASELPEELLVISARAPLTLGFGSYAWYSINFEANSENFSDIPQAKKALEMIGQFLDEVTQTFEIDQNKIFLMGFSQGTVLSTAYALNHPGKVQHVLALSGYVNQQLLREGLDKESFPDLDFFVSHGSVDQVIPVQWARRTPAFLDGLHIENVYMEYPVGHGVAPQNFYDMLEWIKKRI
jgi:phospholipase/carboxylesterase